MRPIIASTVLVAVALVGCAQRSQNIAPGATPAPQSATASGDTNGLGRLLEELNNTLSDQREALATVADLESLLRGRNDTTLRGLLEQLNDSVGGRNRATALELDSLLQTLNDTSLVAALVHQSDSDLKLLLESLKCAGVAEENTPGHGNPAAPRPSPSRPHSNER